jgi:magnesium transporter
MRQLAQVVQRLLHKNARVRVLRLLERVHPSDISQMLDYLRPGEVARLFTEVLSLQRIGEIMEELSEKELLPILKIVTDQRLAEVLQRIDPATAVEVLSLLDRERNETVLGLIKPEARVVLERIISYPEGSAGRAASPILVTLSTSATVQGAIDELRQVGTEDIWDLYVVEPGGQLVGIVPMRRLLVAQPDTEIRELLAEVAVTVESLDPVEEAARVCARYDLMAVPVVDEHHCLVGIITVDDVLDIVEEEATEALYGIAGLETHLRVSSSVKDHLGSRMPWVLLNLVTATLAATVVGSFEATIEEAAFLAAFMPVVAGMGGNMGTQTLTLVTRGLALGEVSRGMVGHILGRQIIVGIVLGVAVGGIMGFGAYLWQDNWLLGLAVLLAIIGTFILGALIGTLVPVVLEAIDRDPAVGSGVIVTATTDILGFLQFLGFAGLLLGLL